MDNPEFSYEIPVRVPDGSLVRGNVVGTESPQGYNLEFEWLDKQPDDVTPTIGAFAQDDYFEAFLTVRRHLEDDGCELLCKGSAVNVWPSGMSRAMGGGIKAYELSLGKEASTSCLVDIFEADPEVEYSQILQQEKHFQQWLSSLGS